MVARIENSGVLVRPTMTAPASISRRTIGASSRAMMWARPATPFGVRWPRTSTLSLMVMGTPNSGPVVSPASRLASRRSAAATALSPRSSVTAFNRGFISRRRATADTATSRHDTSPDRVAAATSVARHCQSGRLLTQTQAMQSISTSELPGMPPAAAIVVRTPGSLPKRPR